MNGSNLARVQSCGWPPGSFYMSFVSLSVNAGSDFTRDALALPMVATRRRASLGGGRDLLGHAISCVCDRRRVDTLAS